MQPKICSICELGESVCAEVARQFLVGLPASDVVSYLASQGHRRTQRQLVDHRRHVVSLKSSRFSPAALTATVTATGTASNPEVCVVEKQIPEVPPSSEEGITDFQREERLILAFLAATDRMLLSLEQTGSIKVSRAATELGALAHNMLRIRMDRAEAPDPVINIILAQRRLEDVPSVREMLDSENIEEK